MPVDAENHVSAFCPVASKMQHANSSPVLRRARHVRCILVDVPSVEDIWWNSLLICTAKERKQLVKKMQILCWSATSQKKLKDC